MNNGPQAIEKEAASDLAGNEALFETTMPIWHILARTNSANSPFPMAPVMQENPKTGEAVSSSNIRLNPNIGGRRSQRILLSVPILISGARSNASSFSERTSTLVVNANGALIRLRERVVMGQKLRMKHLGTDEELPCTVIDINPAAEIPEVGVAFLEARPQFWHVSFPPADWNPRSAEAKRASEPSQPIPC